MKKFRLFWDSSVPKPSKRSTSFYKSYYKKEHSTVPQGEFHSDRRNIAEPFSELS